MTPVETSGRGCRIHLHVAPRSSRTRLCGLHDDRLKIHITAPPTEGKANAAIVKFLAKTLSVSRAAVRFVSGETGKRKTIEVEGLDAAAARERLGLE